MTRTSFLLLPLLLVTSPAWAQGAIMITGDDADDHGNQVAYASFYDEILNDVTNGQTGILSIGADPGTPAGNWIETVAGLMSSPQAVTHVNDGAIPGAVFTNYAILHIPSDSADTIGGINPAEYVSLNARSADVAAFFAGGGGMFALTAGEFADPYGYMADYWGGVTNLTVDPSGILPSGSAFTDVTPTLEGLLLGITDEVVPPPGTYNLDHCCWHNVFLTFPPTMRALARAVTPIPGDEAYHAKAVIIGNILDVDGDRILDPWEESGVTVDGVFLDLPAMGADPHHKDLFVHVDYMVLPGIDGHTHKPKPEALDIMIDTFDAAPVTNPDFVDGIHIHIDAGSDTIMDPVTNATWGALSRAAVLAHDAELGEKIAGVYQWAEFDGHKTANFPPERRPVFHYNIWAHDMGGSIGTSGRARGIPTSDFIVSLGSWDFNTGTINQQAGTMMHELGHDLGLKHGGDDHGNREPNYLSVMNYWFQTRGLRIGGMDGNFDYSRFKLPTLDENNLDETVGISGVAEAAGYGTRWYSSCAPKAARVTDDINGPIDWNWDGDGGADVGIAVDLNCSGAFTVLDNSDNWDEIDFAGGVIGDLFGAVILPDSTPLTEANEDITEPEDNEIPSDFAVSMSGPGIANLSAGDGDFYVYTIANTGELDDTYIIDASATQTWADTSGLPGAVALDSGASAMFNVPVAVPAGTASGSTDLLSIKATSSSNPAIMDSVETLTIVVNPGDLKTFGNGGWGARPRGKNPGRLLHSAFAAVFPGGLIVGDPDGPDGDGLYAIHLTSAQAVTKFLPARKKPRALGNDRTDPTRTRAGVFAGQLVAATLNVRYDAAGVLVPGSPFPPGTLGSLVYADCVDPELLGKSVNQVLDLANVAISGGGTPPGVSIEDLKNALEAFNENFEDGDVNNGCLAVVTN